MKKIIIRGARTHNLKNIDLTIPRDKLVVVTGLSGSGKSSLAFDTLYAEGQRRYVESLSAYARQFLSMMEKPEVDHIEGLSPAISIEQKSTSHNPRSTVGTVTEIYDYLRLLYARVGEPRCPVHGVALSAQTVTQMVDWVLGLPEQTKVMLLAPVVMERKGQYLQLFEELKAKGFVRVRIGGVLFELDDLPELDSKKKHSIEVVVDRLKIHVDQRIRLAESFETALKLAEGLAKVVLMEGTKDEHVFSSRFACLHCGFSLSELEPRLFSFNNPSGACPDCDGLGVRPVFSVEKVIPDSSLSLSEGAICAWDRRNGFYFNLLQSLAAHYDFSLEKPFCKLPKKIQQLILSGSGAESIKFKYGEEGGKSFYRHHAFEGVLNNLERRYKETESDVVREELSRFILQKPCSSCGGTRLCKEARNVFVGDKTLPQLTAYSIEEAKTFFETVTVAGYKQEVAKKILKEVIERLSFLINVGLDYLTLDRRADTLSGGEAQRIRLASQIGAGLVGVMYVLDEPSIGLHAKDNERLLHSLLRLRDLGNTLIVVEHDEEAIRHADYVLDIGPGAGKHGGDIVAQGTPEEIMRNKNSLTGDYLSGRRKIEIPARRVQPDFKKILSLKGAKGNNLKNISVDFPVGLFICITGVSGSGKSTLINDTLYPLVAKLLNGSQMEAAPSDAIEGLDFFDSVVEVDQNPIGRTPRSNPATYTGMFSPIRELFSATPEARARGYQIGRFSFNVKGGRCEACQGDGLIKVEMHFLPDVYVSCDACKGQRYNRETLEIHFKGKNIHDVLNMTVEEAYVFFDAIPVIKRKLKTLIDVGLSYLHLGQSATTLSGGEAQRVKLAKELARRDTGRTLYIFDEPTTGLHFHDVAQLLSVLQRLRDSGNTIIVIEHNLDVVKTADWIIDLGPEGGSKGGQVVSVGTPERVAMCSHSYTGQFLKRLK
ncbi:MAG: excinuclease ABC subunit UvrA [Gammaproteobacteria bacterium]|nr:excinuclease ABC subunit UvrA [Gammaproteobacteria bacterium]